MIGFPGYIDRYHPTYSRLRREGIETTVNFTAATIRMRAYWPNRVKAEQPRGIKRPVPESKLGWRQSVLVTRVAAAVAAELENPFNSGEIVSPRRVVQYGSALQVHGVGISAVRQQEIDGPRPLAADSVVQNRLAARVSGFYNSLGRQRQKVF